MPNEANKSRFEEFLRQVNNENPEGDGVDNIIRGGTEDQVIQIEIMQLSLEARRANSHFAEIQGMLTSDDLNKLKTKAQKTEIYDQIGAGFYVRRAAALKEFDPEWFAENFIISNAETAKLIEACRQMESKPLNYLGYLYNLKILNPQIFSRIEIEPQIWSRVCDVISRESGNPPQFLQDYGKAAFIDYRQTAAFLDIGEFWQDSV